MAERKSVNKYYPPDFDPKVFRSINKYVKHHRNPTRGVMREEVEDDIFESLKDRPSDAFHRTITVRFELPFNVYCLNCTNHIAMGVRFNAEKSHIGMYHSTPVFLFRMKCHRCPAYIQIKTDPKKTEYVIVDGARLKNEAYDPADIGVIVLPDDEQKKKLQTDTFFKLENSVIDSRIGELAAPQIKQIRLYNERMSKDPFTLNQLARKKFRTDKKIRKAIDDDSTALGDKFGISCKILPPSHIDSIIAKSIEFELKEKRLRDTPSTTPKPHQSIFKKRRSSILSKDPKMRLKQIVGISRAGDPFKNF